MRTIDTIPSRTRSQDGHSPDQYGHRSRLLAAASSFWRWFQCLPTKQLTRRGLMELTDDQLKDIGISRSEARREASRPFWN